MFATYTEYDELPAEAQVGSVSLPVPTDDHIVIDFLRVRPRRWAIRRPRNEGLAMLNLVGFPCSIRRVVAAVAGVLPGQRVSQMQHFTYRPSSNGYEEEKLYRGLHPMMGKRLHLWRLSNFQFERLPSVQDVYLIHAFARDNPKDERLVAVAEVRDVTPVRDDAGHIVQLPHLERMLMEALAAIRLFQSRRRSQERLYWNRVFLYVWPPLHLKPNELRDFVRRLQPSAEGLGWSKL